MNRRIVILAGLAVICLGLMVWNYFANRGLITIKAENMPLSKVVQIFERQSGVDIETNLDPGTLVNMNLRHTPLQEALDVLAEETDASWRPAWLLAPSESDIKTALATFRTGNRVEGWIGIEQGAPFMMGGMISSPDPRKVSWSGQMTEPAAKLQDLLLEVGRRTGVYFSLPKEWNPELTRPAKSGRLTSSIPALAKNVGGKSRLVVLLSGRPQQTAEGRSEPPRERITERGPGEGGPGRGGFGGGRGFAFAAERTTNQRGGPGQSMEWVDERIENAIRTLPPAEQEEIRADIAEMRRLMDEIRELPAQDRRAKFEEVMNDPVRQERMAERMDRRDDRSSPEKRAERFQRYVERKVEIKAAQARANKAQ